MLGSGLIPFFLSFLLGYLIGSFPTAYLLVQWKFRIDIRKAGSGNVGAMNTIDVTRSRFVGLLVLFIDLLKGVVAVTLTGAIFGHEFWTEGIGGLGSILGHNYSPWLRFRGGRGLATAAGVLFVLGWFFVVIWCLIWSVTYAVSRNIHVSNILALAISPVIIAVAPENYLRMALNPLIGVAEFSYFVVIVCIIVLLGHVQPIIELSKTLTKEHS